MKRLFPILALAALLAAGALVYALWPRAELAAAPPPRAEPRATAPPAPAAPSAAPALTLEQRRARAERAVADARAAHAAAVSELAAAEAEAVDREREVERLENFVADLKARGEDPAEHAEEGLALFNPALQNYQNTVLRIERAQATLQAAEAGVTSAEQSLAELK
jgi:hypothetical protein